MTVCTLTLTDEVLTSRTPPTVAVIVALVCVVMFVDTALTKLNVTVKDAGATMLAVVCKVRVVMSAVMFRVLVAAECTLCTLPFAGSIVST